MKSNKFIPIKDRISYGGAMIGQEEKDAIMAVIDSQGGRRWTIGEESEAFEKELAKTAGVKGAVVVNSGSSALLVAIASLKLKPGSKVIIPALNFPTAYASILQNGLIPVVVDCNLSDLNINMANVEEALIRYPDIAAVVAIHIAGNMVDLPLLRLLVKDRIIISDNCIAEGTFIKTDKGDKLIEHIKIGDKVFTRKGYRKVLKIWDKGYQEVITRFGVTATSDHKFITTNGKKQLKNLKPSDILFLWNEKLLSIEEKSIVDIQKPNKDTDKSIFGMALFHTIDNFISTTLEKFQKGILFITKTIIPLTMNYQIYSVLLQSNTQGYTSQKKDDSTSHKGTSLWQEMELLNGINQRQVNSFMQNTINGYGLFGRKLTKFVQFVKNLIKLIFKGQSIVQENVKRVFDLTVEGEHEFFANGVLVSNCDGFGSTLNGKFIDAYADVSCVSFHAAHIITMGEGGAILSSNPQILKRARKIREWGRASGSDKLTKLTGFPSDYRERYVFEEVGYNLKPLELQCAMGRIQLKKLAQFKEARQRNYKELYKIFNSHIKFLPITGNNDNCWFSFPFLCAYIKREKVMSYFEKNNIECRTIFSGNILAHPAYKNLPHIQIGNLSNSTFVMYKGMFISTHPSIGDEQIAFIKKVVKEVVK